MQGQQEARCSARPPFIAAARSIAQDVDILLHAPHAHGQKHMYLLAPCTTC
jgi:hypothetical protein